jgi:hypothetical protein
MLPSVVDANGWCKALVIEGYELHEGREIAWDVFYDRCKIGLFTRARE